PASLLGRLMQLTEERTERGLAFLEIAAKLFQPTHRPRQQPPDSLHGLPRLGKLAPPRLLPCHSPVLRRLFEQFQLRLPYGTVAELGDDLRGPRWLAGFEHRPHLANTEADKGLPQPARATLRH